MYDLHRTPPGGPTYLLGRYPNLLAAMDVPRQLPDPYNGKGGPHDWIAVPGIPSKIYVAPETYLPVNDVADEMPRPPWSIEAPGVTRELATLLTTQELAARQWTTSDRQCLRAAARLHRQFTHWLAGRDAAELTHAIGVRAAAWYATSDARPGEMFLTTSDLDELVRAAVVETGTGTVLTAPSALKEITGLLGAEAVMHGVRVAPEPDRARS